jgi:hypothetical protein
MKLSVVVIVILLGLQHVQLRANGRASARREADHTARSATLQDAQRSFYNGDYDTAATITLTLCAARPDDLAACELRSSTLLFQIKKALGEYGNVDKSTAWGLCAACPALMSLFLAETVRGQTLARATLEIHPEDEDILFYLGKLDLNYVWLQSGTLGRKTGWDEYWEARRSLDRVLRMNPDNARARIARAWVDYIVGTRVPRGVRWLLGGGNRKRGLVVVREVVDTGGGDFFVQAEAMFALWDMQVRERQLPGAVATARMLARDFPENRELRRFLALHAPTPAISDHASACDNSTPIHDAKDEDAAEEGELDTGVRRRDVSQIRGCATARSDVPERKGRFLAGPAEQQRHVHPEGWRQAVGAVARR